jgi:hypothetical protein
LVVKKLVIVIVCLESIREEIGAYRREFMGESVRRFVNVGGVKNEREWAGLVVSEE